MPSKFLLKLFIIFSFYFLIFIFLKNMKSKKFKNNYFFYKIKKMIFRLDIKEKCVKSVVEEYTYQNISLPKIENVRI